MGYQQIRAECKCGYKVDKIEFGSTMIMMEVKKIDYMPAYCNTCCDIIGVNILAKPVTCSKCQSNNVKIYGTPEMKGQLVDELDLSSDDFHRRYQERNEALEKFKKESGEEFVPESIEDYREEMIRRHNEKIYEYRTPIFRRYNLCPKCKEYNLRFIEHWSGLHAD